MSRSPILTRKTRLGADSACVAAIFILTLAVYAPALFGGKVLLPADIVPLMAPYAATARERFPEYRFAQNQLHGPIFEYYSWRFSARERIKTGEIPLWNPNELSGNVLLANSQSAVLYPPNALLYLFALPVGINLVTALHTFLTGLFMFGLIRSRGLSPVSALTAALVWMFCGLQTVWTEFQTPTAVLCWLPGILWAWQRYANGGGWRWAVFGAGSGICLALLAGHLHFAFYVLLAFLTYSGITVVRRRWSVVPLAGALAFGLLLSLATILPVVEMSRMNFRGSKSYAESVALAIPPANLFTLVMPNLFGNPRDYVGFDAQGAPGEGWSYWGKYDFIEYACYLGIPGFLLTLVGVFSFRRPNAERENADSGMDQSGGVFILIAGFGLLLALGTPLCAAFFYGAPGYTQFNATARALCLFCFGASALAAYGLEALASGTDRKRVITRMMVAAGIVVAFGLAAFPGMGLVWRRLLTDHWMPYQLAGFKHFALFTALLLAAFWLALRENGRRLIWLIPGVAVADLLVWSAGFNPMTDPAMLDHKSGTTKVLGAAAPARAVSFEQPGGGIKSFIVPNFNAVAGYREVQGADSLHTRRYHGLMEKVALAIEPTRDPPFSDPNTVRLSAGTHPVLDMLNVRLVATKATLPPNSYELRQSAELPIYENKRAMGFGWISPSFVVVKDLDEAFTALNSADDVRGTAILEKDIPPLLPPASITDSVTLGMFAPHRIEVTARSTGEGILTISEPYFPGWRATTNGKPSEILTVNHILRGVRVGAGEHRVVFTYEPASFRLGLYLSCLASGLLAAGIVSVTVRRRRVNS